MIETYNKKRQELGLTSQDFPDPKTVEQRLVDTYYALVYCASGRPSGSSR